MQKKPRILIMDSSTNGSSELEGLLQSLDAETVTVTSYEQVLSAAEQSDFDAAVFQDNAGNGPKVLGLRLPGQRTNTGACQLITQLRALPTAVDLPVILITPGLLSETGLQQLYQAGASDVIPHSLAQALLAERVQHYLTANAYRRAKPRVVVSSEQENAGGQLFKWLSESMEQIARAMASSLDMAEVPKLVLEQLPAVVPYERGSILLRDGEALRIVAQRGFPPGWPISDTRIPIRQGDIFQIIVESRDALLIDDVTQTSAWQQVKGLPLNRSWLGMPLIAKDQVIGMVSLTRREAGAFQPQEVPLLRASASQAAVALVNASLMNDLRRFNEQLEQLVQQRTEELKIAYARLEKIDEAKTSFISITAHELRTPLTLIAGYASLLSTMVKNNPEAGDLVKGIINGEKRLLDVVNSMMDVSKIDNQVLTVRKSTINLPVALKIQRAEFETALRERQLQLVLEDMDQLPAIEADTELITKLFRQLIGNAIKYTPDGGTITVSGRNVVEKGCPAVELMVSDTGIGIDADHHEVIFEKFYQTGPVLQHSSGKTKFKGGGPGLGLAIARGIVQAHGGRIWVESSGHDETNLPGSCFHVILPVN